MHNERLLRVARALLWELKEFRLLPLLNGLKMSLERGERDDDEIERILGSVGEISESAPSNRWPPSWTLMLRDIGGEGLVGRSAYDRLSALFEDYRLSPKAVAALIGELHGEILRFEGILNNFINSSEALERDADELTAGSCEIGILYPFPGVITTLETLYEEIKDLDDALRTFAELGGAAGSLRLRQVSTSLFEVFVYATPAVGALVATAIGKILDLYIKRLQIQKARLEVEKLRLDVDSAKSLRESEQAIMKEGVDAIANHLVKLSVVDNEGRCNELRVATGLSLRFLVAQLDRGVVFEVVASNSTAAGKSFDLAQSEGGADALEAEQLALASERGASMRAFAVQQSFVAIPEQVGDSEIDP